MAVDLAKFGPCVIKSTIDQSSVTVKSFWKETPCVIALLRRFGCILCRLEALELSRFKQALQGKGVRLIAIGHDKDGLEEFKAGNFFDGELYLDESRDTYKSLKYERVGVIPGLWSIASGAGRSVIREAKSKKVEGNLKGDGWQTGGLLVIDKDGKVLYSFKQDKVTDKPDYNKIRTLFDLKEEDLTPLKTELPTAEGK
ncbi:hypothetical protein Aperf_G00000036975 [Anoplocephala perfoliata]